MNSHQRIAKSILSVDIEDYFMVSAFASVVNRADWDRFESRIEKNTRTILSLLEGCRPPGRDSLRPPVRSAGATQEKPKATFFCLGWIAERYPHLIREIHDAGHEVASHGYDHRMITEMTRAEFRQDIRRSKGLLEELIGEEVLGYRAPSYSITPETLWALEILAEEGYMYDSSIFPIHHDRYGIPTAPRFPFIVCKTQRPEPVFRPLIHQDTSGTGALDFRHAMSDSSTILIEFPVSTLHLFGHNLPVAGGGYFRLLPLKITSWAIRHIQERERQPFVFYIHPWELDPAQPRVRGLSPKSRLRHYLNLHKTQDRLRTLLREVSFTSFRNILVENDAYGSTFQTC